MGTSFLLTTIILLCNSYAFAFPALDGGKHTTHRVWDVAPGLQLTTFHPEATYETFGEGIEHPLSKRTDATVEEAAAAFVKSRLSLSDDDISTKSSFDGEVSKHAYFSQKIKGIPVANAVANVALNHANKIIAFGNNFVKPKTVSSSTPTLTVSEAISIAEKTLLATHNDHPPSTEFFAKDDGSVVLTHVVQVENADHWFEAFVDAHNGEIVNVIDFVAQASYSVIPIQNQDISQGPLQRLFDPADPQSSPFGWHSDGTPTINTTVTAGNNAIAFKGTQTATASQTTPVLNFIYILSGSGDPPVNLNVAIVNAFYVVNTVHDFTYRYGFKEAAFNFQNNNFGKGGQGNDRVTISVQDASATNTASFATPPDGQSGSMRMFVWTSTNPNRDGALENDILVHEATHGLTNRMTGGGTARCLSTNEAGGMGEGWSDVMADWTEQTSAITQDFTFGRYVTDNPAGIRSHPYSTSPTVNPLTYASLRTFTNFHDIGEVWANILHTVYAFLVNLRGFSTTARTDPSGTEGNVVFLHLMIDALALQPCNPTFLTARDAIIIADANRYGGANNCALWNAFASRGLGLNAVNHTDNFVFPSGC